MSNNFKACATPFSMGVKNFAGGASPPASSPFTVLVLKNFRLQFDFWFLPSVLNAQRIYNVESSMLYAECHNMQLRN